MKMSKATRRVKAFIRRRARAESRRLKRRARGGGPVKTYTEDELRVFAAARGLTVSPSILTPRLTDWLQGDRVELTRAVGDSPKWMIGAGHHDLRQLASRVSPDPSEALP